MLEERGKEMNDSIKKKIVKIFSLENATNLTLFISAPVFQHFAPSFEQKPHRTRFILYLFYVQFFFTAEK